MKERKPKRKPASRGHIPKPGDKHARGVVNRKPSLPVSWFKKEK